jgi:hypothetical protein
MIISIFTVHRVCVQDEYIKDVLESISSGVLMNIMYVCVYASMYVRMYVKFYKYRLFCHVSTHSDGCTEEECL